VSAALQLFELPFDFARFPTRGYPPCFRAGSPSEGSSNDYCRGCRRCGHDMVGLGWKSQKGECDQAAEYFGMSLKTLLENYGHHHPDYLSGPRDAFDRAPMDRQRKLRTERDRTQTNVMKIADRSR
jgi:hypothetical protein